MKPRHINHKQDRLFQQRLSELLNPRHELLQLSKQIDWKAIEQQVIPYFEEEGRPAKPIRLIVGMFMLQQISGLSDEMTVYRWVENPYWQLFCGYDFYSGIFRLILQLSFVGDIGSRKMV